MFFLIAGNIYWNVCEERAVLMIDFEKNGWDSKTIGELDHQSVKAPYIRIMQCKEGLKGDPVFLFDLRFTQPNKNYIKPEVMHSLEHFLLVGFRKHMEGFSGVAPMGCQTGFYLTVLNECSAEKMVSNFEEVLNDILLADEVPLNNIKDCGQAHYHDLKGAKEAAKNVLKEKQNWLTVFAAEGGA
jgi:S-ribosylhomocysteine lyase